MLAGAAGGSVCGWEPRARPAAAARCTPTLPPPPASPTGLLPERWEGRKGAVLRMRVYVASLHACMGRCMGRCICVRRASGVRQPPERPPGCHPPSPPLPRPRHTRAWHAPPPAQPPIPPTQRSLGASLKRRPPHQQLIRQDAHAPHVCGQPVRGAGDGGDGGNGRGRPRAAIRQAHDLHSRARGGAGAGGGWVWKGVGGSSPLLPSHPTHPPIHPSIHPPTQPTHSLPPPTLTPTHPLTSGGM